METYSSSVQQLSLDDFTSEQVTEDGIKRSKDHANPGWFNQALSVVEQMSHNKREITVNDVWNEMDRFPVETHDNSAMGPVMREAAKRGWVIKDSVPRKSDRPSRHGGFISVWKSLTFVS